MQKVMPLLLMFIWTLSFTGNAQKVDKDLWQSWKEVSELAQKTQQPVFIDIYTNWCRYCKIMDATTYQNDSVKSYLKSNFLRFKFNAESKDTLIWNSQVFAFNQRYDVHDFAVYLTRGSIVYPTTVIIMPGGQPFYKHGEIKPAEMEMLLKYFTGENFKISSLEAFAVSFIPQWN